MRYGIPKTWYGNGIKNYHTEFPVYRKIRYGIGMVFCHTVTFGTVYGMTLKVRYTVELLARALLVVSLKIESHSHLLGNHNAESNAPPRCTIDC